MTWLWTLLGLAGLVVGLDRLGLWAEARGWIYWRRSRPSATGSGGDILTDLIELFQPAHRHLVEEQQYERRTIAQFGSAAPPLDVDLDAGTATLRPDDDAGDRPPNPPARGGLAA